MFRPGNEAPKKKQRMGPGLPNNQREPIEPMEPKEMQQFSLMLLGGDSPKLKTETTNSIEIIKF